MFPQTKLNLKIKRIWIEKLQKVLLVLWPQMPLASTPNPHHFTPIDRAPLIILNWFNLPYRKLCRLIPSHRRPPRGWGWSRCSPGRRGRRRPATRGPAGGSTEQPTIARPTQGSRLHLQKKIRNKNITLLESNELDNYFRFVFSFSLDLVLLPKDVEKYLKSKCSTRTYKKQAILHKL